MFFICAHKRLFIYREGINPHTDLHYKVDSLTDI